MTRNRTNKTIHPFDKKFGHNDLGRSYVTFLLTHIFIRIVASLGVIDPMSGPKIKDEDTRNISSPEDDEETAVKLFKVSALHYEVIRIVVY